MQSSFFFYDLETSGFDPKTQRIMQFAGQRTDMDLRPMGEPVNLLVKLTEDILPDPQAILVTGITPQKTLDEGYTEAEFLAVLHNQVLTPGTIMTGFNNVRFDDEFMRFALYRNFYDPYEWAYKDGRSRWDMLDVVRMTRALRPDGIAWPVDAEGQPTNRLELLAAENGLDHAKAHDALSDVQALIAVAALIKQKQPKLFDYLLGVRDKKAVAGLVNLENPQPFVYTSGRYPKGIWHTTVAYPLAPGSKPGSVIVYDLRHDPRDWAALNPDDLKKIFYANYEQRLVEGFVPLPAKELSYNRCPAVAPLGVLDEPTQARLKIDLKLVQQNIALLARTDLADKLAQVFGSKQFAAAADVDAQLYDGFISDDDKAKMSQVRALAQTDSSAELANALPAFVDKRLEQLVVRFKARNAPLHLSDAERAEWEAYRSARLGRELPKYMQTLGQLAAQAKTTSSMFILEELQLWAQSIAPVE